LTVVIARAVTGWMHIRSCVAPAVGLLRRQLSGIGSESHRCAWAERGFYERASTAEIVEYFNRVLEDDLIPTGRVRFFAMCDYCGADSDGHRFVSLLSGEPTTVRVRRAVVDATYVESSIPSRHTPGFEIDADVRLLPPNDLVDLSEPASGFTIIGAGKTAMDTCNWLLDAGVDAEKIRWIRKRDGWFFNRTYMQPLDLVASYMQLQAGFVEHAAACDGPRTFTEGLEADGILLRIDPDVEPDVFRGATLSRLELDSLREIDNIVRLGRVRRIGAQQIAFDDAELSTDPREVYVDCTAAGVRPVEGRAVFDRRRITMQYVTIGIAPWSAATIAAVEASDRDDDHKNALCPPVSFTGEASDILHLAFAGMTGLTARGMESDVATWTERCRLNPARGAADHLDDPRVEAAFGSMADNLGPAMLNLEQLTT
jgi:hypothetical protein